MKKIIISDYHTYTDENFKYSLPPGHAPNHLPGLETMTVLFLIISCFRRSMKDTYPAVPHQLKLNIHAFQQYEFYIHV